MDFELKEFEDKINNITEQFMSLLDSDKDISATVGNRYDTIASNCASTVDYGTTAGGVTSDGISTNISNGISFKNGGFLREPVFKLKTEDISIGGIAYGGTETYKSDIPSHAVRFDTVEQRELNQKLEGLYESKRTYNENIFNEKPTIAFSDSNLVRINNTGVYNSYEDYTKDKTNSTLNDKEVYEMSNYYGEGNNGYVIGGKDTTENAFYSFATIPAERALVEKKSWKDVLFMDIPWDTKIDIWGGIKKFCTAQVKITF